MKLKVLILSKDLSAEGGIANFVKMLMASFGKNVESENFSTGSGDRITGRLRGAYFVALDSFRLARKINHEKYDCVHINSSLNIRSLLRDGIFLLILLTLNFNNIVVFFHGWEKSVEKHIKKNKILRTLFRKALGPVPKILVLGSQFKDALIDIGVSEQKIIYTTTFFDGSIFHGAKKQTNFNKKRLLYLSRLIREKGIFETLEAFSLLAPEFPDMVLSFAGDGPEMHSLQEKVEEYGIESRVEFFGYVRGSTKAQLLMNSDIFILPTLYGEGCPIALLEAMAAGLPVITCPVGGIPDIFVDGKNGFLLSKVSSTAIADAIRRLIQEPDLSAMISKNNCRYAWENFELKSVAEKFERLYVDVIEQYRKV